MLLDRVFLLALSILVVSRTSSAEQYVTDHYIYWSNASIQSPKLFAIDASNERIVLAAKNNVCHLTMDLNIALNVRNASPTYDEIDRCENDGGIFKPIEECHNFHHIILFPNADTTITVNNQTIAGNETVLVCGSNAYHPKCIYRNRTDLSELKVYTGVEFSPYDEDTVSASLLSSSGKLLSGTSLNVNADKYGFTMSNSPFDGATAVRTIPGLLMFNKPKFVDIYERGDYFYFFMREEAEESNSDSQIYSRAARVCKNETGTPYLNKGYSVFTTYLKARMTCESTLKVINGFPYIYNDLQDTVHIADGTIDNSIKGEYLYGIFTSPVNGPAGSVLCVYTFDKKANDLTRVFKENYLVQSGENLWTSETNLHPVTCGNRSTSEADDHFLMEPVVTQARSPLIQEDGLLYQRLIVDQVTGVNGVKYDVLIIGAIDEESNVYLLKKTYVSSRGGDHVHTSQTIPLNHTSNQIVGKMELYKNNDKVSVYLSTNEGLYSVDISDCSKYKDCSACVGARDPYCAYNSISSSCVSTLSNKGVTLLQDVVNGNTESCPIISTASVTLTPTTSRVLDNVVTSTLTMTSSVCTNTVVFTTVARETITATTTVVITPTPRPVIISTTAPTIKSTVYIPIRTEPSIVPISENSGSGEDYIWTIVAACGGLIVGIVLGLICFALIRNKDRFCWGKFLSRRKGYNYDEEKIDDGFEMTQAHKMQDTRNNSYSKVPQRPSTPPLTKLNPTLANGGPSHKVTDSPVLSKYSNTERTHNRSMSSGGQFIPTLFPVPTNGTTSSPIRANLRHTFHVEEPMNNSQRQKFGKNVVGRQLSKEYPMTNSFHAHTNGYHVKTGSLDLDYDKLT